jgi:single-strand DNA-binding protein
MINNVVLVGRMTRDAELRYTPSNVATATFTLAVNRTFKNQAGEREADFINCVIWRQQAENLANWAKKGALIGVTGRIQTRNYENAQGQRVYVTEVVAENFQMLESCGTRRLFRWWLFTSWQPRFRRTIVLPRTISTTNT